MVSKIPVKVFCTFEEIWKTMSKRQKEINMKHWHNLYSENKILEPIEKELKNTIIERDYWKARFNSLQSRLSEPLDEIFSGKLFLKDALVAKSVGGVQDG